MQTRIILLATFFSSCLAGCFRDNQSFDASGTFEADEVIVSSEMPGKLLSLNIEEGSVIARDSIVAVIDSVPLLLQREHLEASLKALREKTSDVTSQVKLLLDQIAVQKVQLANLIYEKGRTERLVKADAATAKQLDDINTQIEVLKKQMDVTEQQIRVQQTTVSTQNRAVLSESGPLKKSVEQIQDQVRRMNVVNPINGTVLAKYAMAGEMTAAGKALYKIADLSTVILRAYISGAQLSEVKLNQPVTVLVDERASKYREYPGTITWISDKAEFTPKTIQTREERANLVYAIKVKVKNDGYLKIGMYGDLRLAGIGTAK